MPNCLHITAHIDPRFGGLATSVPALARAMNAAGWYQNSVIAFCDSDEIPPLDLGVPQETYPFGRFRWALDRSLRHKLEQRIRAASSLHIHGVWQEHGHIAAALAKRAGVPYIVSAHGMLEPWALRQKAWKKRVYAALIERNTLNRAHCMRALTAAEAENYRLFGYQGRIEIIPNGIDIPQTADPAPFFTLHPDLKGKRIILFLGRLHKKKGVELLCHAWQQIAASIPDCVLVFAGPDSDETPGLTATLVSKLGIGNSVRFTGMLRDELKWSALSAATIFVLPSFSEGFSVAILEALATGTPVLISKACYFPEVQAPRCGWIIDPQVDVLAETLLRSMTASPEELSDMGKKGISLVRNQYAWPLIGTKMTDLHRDAF